jgi:formate dehydrogenase maturation protein FdhE
MEERKAMIVYSDWETRRIYCNDCADEPDVSDLYYEVELGPLDAVQCVKCEQMIKAL